jgi:hypothetical protein
MAVCGIGALVWGFYYGLFVRPHYLADYRYLFSANAYTGATLATLRQILSDTFLDGTWMGATLFVVAMAAIIGSMVDLCIRRSRSNPVAAALVLWIFGYAAFLAYHDNLQPRYYLVIAIPLTMLAAFGFDVVLAGAIATYSHSRVGVSGWLLRFVAGASGAALVFAAINGARETIGYVLRPEYTWVGAAQQIRGAIDREIAAHPDHSRLVLSISGSDLSLMTGLPSICDDFGTAELPQRVAMYHPGWFATWNNVEDDKMDALTPTYRLVRVGAYPAFDDPERNLLILYRLDPANAAGRSGGRGRKRYLGAPHKPRVKAGQQPSPTQLKH